MNYKLSFNYCPKKNCGKIFFNENHVLVDFVDLFTIINSKKNFLYYTKHKLYPYFLKHTQMVTIRAFIFKFNDQNIEYIFKI